MKFIFIITILINLTYLILKYPGYSYIIGLTLFYNIGGYLDKYTLDFPLFFTFIDSCLILSAFAVLINVIFEKRLFFDQYFKKLLMICLIFSIYQIIITISANLGIYSGIELIRRIGHHKWRIFGIYFSIPTYFVIQKHSKEIYKAIVIITFTIITIYFITLATPLKLIEVIRFDREMIMGAERVTFDNYGYMLMVIPMAVIAYLQKIKIDLKSILIFSAIGMIITVSITLTRITIFGMLGSILIALILSKKYFGLNLSKIVIRGFIFVGIALLILSSFHNVLDSIYRVFLLTFFELIGIVPEGTTQGRTTFELAQMTPLFLNNLWIGTGYLEDFFNAYHTKYELGLADVPILGNLAIYGILGFIIYLIRYFQIYKRIKTIFNKHKEISLFHRLTVYEIILLVWATIFFFKLIFFRLFVFSLDLVYGNVAVEFGFFVGIIYGLANKYELSYNNMNRSV